MQLRRRDRSGGTGNDWLSNSLPSLPYQSLELGLQQFCSLPNKQKGSRQALYRLYYVHQLYHDKQDKKLFEEEEEGAIAGVFLLHIHIEVSKTKYLSLTNWFHT